MAQAQPEDTPEPHASTQGKDQNPKDREGHGQFLTWSLQGLRQTAVILALPSRSPRVSHWKCGTFGIFLLPILFREGFRNSETVLKPSWFQGTSNLNILVNDAARRSERPSAVNLGVPRATCGASVSGQEVAKQDQCLRTSISTPWLHLAGP